MTKKVNFDAMSVDEMWQLHEEIARILSARLIAEKRALEKRLDQLRRDKEIPPSGSPEETGRERRKYPPVHPKYRNPKDPSETWSGRGKTPRWLVAALKAGHVLEDFAIRKSIETLAREPKKVHNAT